jgi:hypothetical protein
MFVVAGKMNGQALKEKWIASSNCGACPVFFRLGKSLRAVKPEKHRALYQNLATIAL